MPCNRTLGSDERHQRRGVSSALRLRCSSPMIFPMPVNLQIALRRLESDS